MPVRTRYEVQRMIVDPTNEDPDWEQISIPDTLSTARTHARRGCGVGPGTVTRVLVNGIEQDRYEYSYHTHSQAQKVRMWE